MRKESPFDVLVVGAGIAGLSTIFHLQKLGVSRLALAADSTVGPVSTTAAGFIAGGQLDNFTRIAHNHGTEQAVGLWEFGDRAFDALVAYSREQKVPHATDRRLRLIMSEHERKEAEQATRGMATAGLKGSLQASTSGSYGVTFGPNVLAVQDDGPRGGWVDTPRLLASLQQGAAGVASFPAIAALQTAGGQIVCHCHDGTLIRSEIVVLAAHLGIAALLPELAPALVTVADQWTDFATTESTKSWPAIAFTANNTYEWGVFTGPQALHIGGGRYLRPGAGIEATQATADVRIATHLQTWGQAVFPKLGPLRMGQTRALLDINPCDELPIIGPMFGNGRILVATGYLNSGLTQGFYSGQCLAELIGHGTAAGLPRRLWPERLRSMES